MQIVRNIVLVAPGLIAGPTNTYPKQFEHLNWMRDDASGFILSIGMHQEVNNPQVNFDLSSLSHAIGNSEY